MASATLARPPDSGDVEIQYILPPEAAVISQMRGELIYNIEPVILFPYLNCLTKADEQAIAAKDKQEGHMLANLILLDKIVKRENFWIDLLEALRNDTAVGLGWLAVKLEEALAKHKEDEKTAKRVQSCKQNPSGLSNKDKEQQLVYEKTVTPEAAPTQASQTVQHEVTTTTHKVTYDEDMNLVMSEMKLREVYRKHLKLTEKSPREYQKVLASQAMKGKNTIMCAPTGCGKTMAASLVCKAHLEKSIPVTKKVNNDSGEGTSCEIIKQPSIPNPKILFLVPRNAILEHVYRELTGYLALWSVGSRRGNSPQKKPLHELMKSHDVIVATADIFKNAILKENTMKINDPTLIIFDECHHTTLDHTYNQIMHEYLKFKQENPNTKLPQIVGLSASPGAGKTPSENSAVVWILKLCANLDAEVFQTIPEELQEELSHYIPTPNKSIHPAGSRVDDPFSEKIIEAMIQIERRIKLKRGHEKHGSAEYQSLITLVQQEAVEKLDDFTRRYAEHLLCYNEVLLLIRVARFKDGLSLLREFYLKIKNRQTTDKDEVYLLSVFTVLEPDLEEITKMEDTYPNPKLTTLHELLLSHQAECKRKEQAFRAIVFVKTKALAKVLKEWMESDGQLVTLHPEVFTGVRADEKAGGMTEAQQNSILSRFDKGEIQVLISTSVGEEGVDVPACNVVIRYDDVKNEISMVQSRGRARAMEAHEVVIGESQTIEKHEFNLLMEDVMNVGIQRVQALSEEQFRHEIGHLQSVALAQKRQKEIEKQRLQTLNEASNIVLKCKGPCGQEVCKASDMRIANKTHYVNRDKAFEEKITLKEHTREDYKKKGIQKVHCKACGQDWGNTSGSYPTLALKSFLVIIDGQGKTIKQWSKIPCTIPPLKEHIQLPW